MYLKLLILEWLFAVATYFSKIITALKVFPNVNNIFQSDYPTWVNTLRFASTRRYLYADNHSIQGHCTQTSQVWHEFGKALGFTEQMARDLKLGCAYPRCVTPQFVGNLVMCGACKDTYYCSVYCQTGLADLSSYLVSILKVRLLL